ncbi:MAG: class I tRNA ligase family protein, partial [Enterobacteriaceae bacterium]|nr:class I tRNA ligase family protein [Enterobacteriaceae bacterium]
YTSSKNGLLRKSVQSAIYYIINLLTKLLSPILSFTSEEIWQYIPGDKEQSVFLSELDNNFLPMIGILHFFPDQWDSIFVLKCEINKFLENFRKNGIIGSFLEADVSIFCDSKWYNLLLKFDKELYIFFIVSSVNIFCLLDLENSFYKTSIDGVYLKFDKIRKKKCERCWYRNIDNILSNKFVNICDKCVNSLYGKDDIRIYF